jgi:hypothetical protein
MECKSNVIKYKTVICSLWSTRKPLITVLYIAMRAVTSETENMGWAKCVCEWSTERERESCIYWRCQLLTWYDVSDKWMEWEWGIGGMILLGKLGDVNLFCLWMSSGFEWLKVLWHGSKFTAIPISRSRKFAGGVSNYLAQRATDEKLNV